MATKMKDWESEWKSIAAESRRLAKRANQRMKRLEDYSEREGLSNIKKYAYAKAEEYIKHNLGVGKKGVPRFKEHIKLYNINDGTKELTGQALYKANVMIQRHRIKAMEEFLGSESSTLGQSRSGPKTEGIKNIYDKRTQTINEKFLNEYGLEMTEQDLKRFFESKKQAKLEKDVGSPRMFVVASIIKKYNLKTNKKDLEKFLKNHIDLNQYKEADLAARKGEGYKDYLDRVRDYMQFTDDQVLNDMVIKALKSGINADNIFI